MRRLARAKNITHYIELTGIKGLEAIRDQITAEPVAPTDSVYIRGAIYSASNCCLGPVAITDTLGRFLSGAAVDELRVGRMEISDIKSIMIPAKRTEFILVPYFVMCSMDSYCPILFWKAMDEKCDVRCSS